MTDVSVEKGSRGLGHERASLPTKELDISLGGHKKSLQTFE